MATPAREKLAKKLLNSHDPALGNSSVMNKRRHSSTHAAHPQRGHRLQQLPSPKEHQLQQRENGWNDRFFYEPPINSNKLPRPSNNTPISPQKQSAAARQRKNEKKVREERLQYGNNEMKRKLKESRQPANGRLMPLNFLADPTMLHPSKEEKLRIKALKAIDARENLLYQLNALILCTPAQETLFQPSHPVDPPSSFAHSGFQRVRAKADMALAPTPSSRFGTSGAMTNSRETTKLAQKLAEDLQLAGIQCVEAIVEWMLEVGAKAEKPPPFLWRERNYFLKMYNDLDFAQAELEARGVHLECYTQQNPLLIRTNQKLGRVLAAQAIITKMVEMATANSIRLPLVTSVDHGFEKQPEDSDILSAVDSKRDGFECDANTRSGSMDDLARLGASRPPEPESAHSGDDRESEEEAESEGDATARGDDQDQEDEYGSEEDDDSRALPSSHEVDASAADELVHILDESFSDLVKPSLPFADQGDENAMLSPITTAREDVRSVSEYDNSFEDAADADSEHENQQTHESNEDAENASSLLGREQKEKHEDEPEVAERSEIVESDESTINPLDDSNIDNQQSAELQSLARNDSDDTSAIEKEDESDKEEGFDTTEEEPGNEEKFDKKEEPFLRIEMPFATLTTAEKEKVLLMLPQSHTCDNTLELPHYWRALCWKKQHDEHLESQELEDELAALLTKKLEDAVEYSSGYGLDGTSTVSGIFPEKSGKQPGNSTSRSDLAKEESYESLDLPGIGDSAGPSSRAQTPLFVPPMEAEALSPLRQEPELLPAEVLDEPERSPTLPSSSSSPSLTSSPLSAAPTSAETPATVEETMAECTRSSAASPAKSARPQQQQRDDDDESYAENDWEEE